MMPSTEQPAVVSSECSKHVHVWHQRFPNYQRVLIGSKRRSLRTSWIGNNAPKRYIFLQICIVCAINHACSCDDWAWLRHGSEEEEKLKWNKKRNSTNQSYFDEIRQFVGGHISVFEGSKLTSLHLKPPEGRHIKALCLYSVMWQYLNAVGISAVLEYLFYDKQWHEIICFLTKLHAIRGLNNSRCRNISATNTRIKTLAQTEATNWNIENLNETAKSNNIECSVFYINM